MTHWTSRFLSRLALLGFLVATPGLAQDTPDRRTELGNRIGERFTSMLHSELALSDSQAKIVLPAMADLEQYKREIGRERRDTVRRLQSGMRAGASDENLQELLDRLDRIEDEQRAAERDAMAQIDAELNTRQRVKLRFFVQHFRQQIESRLSNRTDRLDRRRLRQEGPRRPERR